MKSEINPTFDLKGIGTRRGWDGVDAVVTLYRFYRKTCIETYMISVRNVVKLFRVVLYLDT